MFLLWKCKQCKVCVYFTTFVYAVCEVLKMICLRTSSFNFGSKFKDLNLNSFCHYKQTEVHISVGLILCFNTCSPELPQFSTSSVVVIHISHSWHHSLKAWLLSGNHFVFPTGRPEARFHCDDLLTSLHLKTHQDSRMRRFRRLKPNVVCMSSSFLCSNWHYVVPAVHFLPNSQTVSLLLEHKRNNS